MESAEPTGKYTVAWMKQLVENKLIFIPVGNVYVWSNRDGLAALNGLMLDENLTLNNNKAV